MTDAQSFTVLGAMAVLCFAGTFLILRATQRPFARRKKRSGHVIGI